MKKIYSNLILTLVLSMSWTVSATAGSRAEFSDDESDYAAASDSIMSINTLSETDDYPTYFPSVIPPPPQAAAITRYASYPVSHTTGLPEISVPLYEIDLGGYNLPISISYHASGARPDDMPGYVGSGWILNAGGAVTRTILGKPDREMTHSTIELPCYDNDFIGNMIEELQKTGKGPGLAYIPSIVGEDTSCDTESDRYSFNVAGKSGVFRYSHADKEYVVLNNSNWIVESIVPGPRFRIVTNDQVEYEFDEEERSGPNASDTEPAYAAAWYVTRIGTPYGDITFKYGSGYSLTVRRTNVQATAGLRLELEEQSAHIGQNKYVYVYNNRKRVDSSVQFYTYQQRPLESIEWQGGKITFEYDEGHPYVTLKRLTGMKVYDSAGNLRKSVEFDNTDNWPTNDSRSGRRLLKKVTDSESGIWTFDYYKPTGMPEWSTNPTPNCLAQHTDLWGYLNTFKYSAMDDVFTEKQSKWLQEAAPETSWHIGTRDRSPSLEHTKAGILNKITFPTGASISYTYELNYCAGIYYGGLRLKSYTVNDGYISPGRTTTFEYKGARQTTEHPEDLMNYLSYQQMNINPDYGREHLGWNSPQELRTCVPFPINPVTASSCPVAYSLVTEKRPDGTSVEYHYDEYELSDLHGVGTEYEHPSLYYQSVNDRGISEPLLLSRTIFDKDKTPVFKETFTYEKKTRRAFSAGVRTACPYFEFMVPSNVWQPVTITPENVAHFGMLQHTPSTAYSRANLLKSKTSTDLKTGFSTSTSYSYDDSLRTMLPRSETVTGSDGTVLRKEYTYTFDHTDATSVNMVKYYYMTDSPVETRVFEGSALVEKSKIEYALFNDWYFPVTYSSWSAPTASSLQAAPASLPVREKISGYNLMGRPLSIKMEDTDLTSFTWNDSGEYLTSSTAPGGLTTAYTHRPLFGLTSVTAPNGYKTTYGYNTAGMLSSVADTEGPFETYAYSIANHYVSYLKGNGNSVTTTRFLSTTGPKTVLTRQYCDGLGRPTAAAEGGHNVNGKYLYTARSYDALGRESQTVLQSVGSTDISDKTFDDIKALSASTYSDQYAWSETSYDAMDRPVKISTPGEAWHSAAKGKTTEYVTNAANSVRLYRAPSDRISLTEDGYYAAGTLQGVRSVDEDGKEMTVYTDRLGRKVLERRGPESGKGMNDTYFVYNGLGQLRYVLTPGYELSGFKDKFAYEYRYDERGNIVKKFIPDAGYTQYWYDRAGRMAFMQDPNLRERGLHRFFVYDRAGRLAIQGVSASCGRNQAVNFADFTGGTGGFMQTGYSLADASRIQQATLEIINYYDGYTFAGLPGGTAAPSGAADATGMLTGTVTYASDGSKSVAATYYDIRGNVIECRESTAFGTERKTVNSYTYSGQPLKSTMTEGAVTVVTENTYHAASGLLTATDVTINGVKQRVAAIAYDDLGRMVSVTRGASQKSGGTVTYKYNLHGQTTEISGPGLTQNLYFADWSGTKHYNGSVSAMTWTMGSDPTLRGYSYRYNTYGWLTSADYGEGSSLSSRKDRYSERSLEFMRNGGARRLQRHGLKADGVYGKIDNLHIYYDGNRIKSVLEDADPVTQYGSMDYPGANREMAFAYNEWGALVSDESRGITAIKYDNLGNPVRIEYDGWLTTNVYSATGERLKTLDAFRPAELPAEPLTALPAMGLPGEQVYDKADNSFEYHGPVVYKNGKVDMVLFPGGYATVEGGVTFHYYTQDYLGNNRAVINGSTGAIEQTVAYYPYGGVIADLGTNLSKQQYKFGGKELMTANGLNEYDFGARRYYSAVPHFTSPDPLCEKYYWLSPYLYCANNPVNLIDPTGMYITKESLKEWDRNKKSIEKARADLRESIDKILAEGAKKRWSSDKIAGKIGDKLKRVASLDNTLSTMTILENSDQGYSLSHRTNQKNDFSGVFLKDGSIIDIKYTSGDISSFVHEVTHAGQFESGDIAFFSDTGGVFLCDIYDEINAFSAQYAYAPKSIKYLSPGRTLKNIGDINPLWIRGISINGNNVYDTEGSFNTGRIPININSPISTLYRAYPKNKTIPDIVSTYNQLKDIPNMYYK